MKTLHKILLVSFFLISNIASFIGGWEISVDRSTEKIIRLEERISVQDSLIIIINEQSDSLELLANNFRLEAESIVIPNKPTINSRVAIDTVIIKTKDPEQKEAIINLARDYDELNITTDALWKQNTILHETINYFELLSISRLSEIESLNIQVNNYKETVGEYKKQKPSLLRRSLKAGAFFSAGVTTGWLGCKFTNCSYSPPSVTVGMSINLPFLNF